MGIAIATLVLVRWWTNSMVEEAERRGEAKGEAKQLKLQEGLWKSRLESLTNMRLDLNKDYADAQKSRARIKGDLAKGVADIKQELAGIKPRVDQIKPSEYDATIRQLIGETP